jgi:diadenosine tetraphosphate (Ap4A) HIT family hydrolase
MSPLEPFMNHRPAAERHALVIPKTHATDIWELRHHDGVEVWRLLHTVARAAREALRPDGLNSSRRTVERGGRACHRAALGTT